MKKKILVILSDPNSINYEIIKKTLFFFKKKNKNEYIFIGSQKHFANYITPLKNNLNFINIDISKNTRLYLKKCFVKSFELLKNKKAHGLINLPLDKKYLPSKYPGFTEYISNYFKTSEKETMLLYSNNFSVCPNTTHVLIKKVSSSLSKKKIINNIYNINSFYKNIIGKTPRLAIMGLNPHNGIDFSTFTEEEKILKPAIKIVKKNNIRLIGPLVPDSAFHQIKDKNIDCLIGNYHDQVLPFFKYKNRFNGINITLGLPFIRMSPDHGTGKDIIDKKSVRNDSFLFCLNFFEKYSKKI